MNKCKKCGKEITWDQTVELYEERGNETMDKLADLCVSCFKKLETWLGVNEEE